MWKKPVDSDSPEQPVQPETRPAAAPRTNRPSGPSIIGPSIMLRGDVTGDEDLVVKGKVEGTLALPNNDIQVDPEGQVKADLKAQKISVAGKVQGNLVGSERVVIEKSGQVDGNIVAPRVVLEDGCNFKGSVEMNVQSGGAKMQQLGVASEQSKANKLDKQAPNPGPARASGTP